MSSEKDAGSVTVTYAGTAESATTEDVSTSDSVGMPASPVA